MKKLLFTALAVVAFSGIAMAKTVEVKEDKVLLTDCATSAAEETNRLEASSGGCYTSSQWQSIYAIVYNRCTREKRLTEA